MSESENRPVNAPERERLSVPLDDPHSVEPVEEIPPQEPLFNKRAMFLWALGAFIVWFAVTRAVPRAKEAAKAAIVQRVKEAEQNRGGTVTIRRNGEVITITRTPESQTGTAAPAASANPAADAKPAIAPTGPTATPVATPTPPEKPKAPEKR